VAVDPIAKFNRWFAEARRAGIEKAEAMALATADGAGRPSVRFVLLKQADARGFVFYTNGNSRKGRELRDNPRASLALHWERLGKQVRVEGRIEELSAPEVDVYWATRPRESQLAAQASRQSAPLTSRGVLLARWRALRHKFAHHPVPRPAGWTGFRIVPDAIEFWTHSDHRLHDRELFTRASNAWKRQLLQP